MSFSIVSLYSCHQADNTSLLSKVQILGAIIDSVLVAAVCLTAGLCLAHLTKVFLLPNSASYILLGSAAVLVLADVVALALHSHRKFLALKKQLEVQKGASISENNTKDTQIEDLKQRLLEIEIKREKTQNQNSQEVIDLQQQIVNLKEVKQIESNLRHDQESEITALNQQLQTKNVEIEDLNKELQELREKIAKTSQNETEIRNLKQAITKEKEISQLQSGTIHNQKLSIQSLEKQIVELKGQSPGVQATQRPHAAMSVKRIKKPPSKIRVVVTIDSKNCPYLEKDRILVTQQQHIQMGTDPFFSKFLTPQWNVEGEHVNAFLVNLRIFLDPKIHPLFKRTDTLGLIKLKQDINHHVSRFREFFNNQGLSREASPLQLNTDKASETIYFVLENLNHAQYMDNIVLTLFWCQVLEKHAPLDQCIDQFKTILEHSDQVSHPEYLHEILFETLLKNFNHEDTKKFLQIYPHKLRVKTFKLSSFLSLTQSSSPLEANFSIENRLDSVLKIIECGHVEVLYYDCGFIDDLTVSLTQNKQIERVGQLIEYILLQCTLSCLRLGYTLSSAEISSLSSLKQKTSVIDMTDYRGKTDSDYFKGTPERVYAEKESSKTADFACIIYLLKDSEKADAYLKKYRGVELKHFEAI